EFHSGWDIAVQYPLTDLISCRFVALNNADRKANKVSGIHQWPKGGERFHFFKVACPELISEVLSVTTKSD
ncbi:hypothetical protein AVEN_103260-1, partial [Araneus ventricosus]